MAKERVQRRLAAILAADVVGYSRLMEFDEASTRARLTSLHSQVIDPLIAEDGGRIFKRTGDGILVEFPSAVDAVQNAMALQEEIAGRNDDLPESQRLVFRMGINLGDVIIEGDDIHGDGVNVAARLEALCEPGGVYISGSVYDQVTNKIAASFVDLGERTVKNISRPVRVFRAGPGLEITTVGTEATKPPPLPSKPSIAVLPFTSLDDDPSQDSFADGLRLAIQGSLVHVPGLFNIAPTGLRRYRSWEGNALRVAQEVGVRYVLEGAAQRSDQRVRINVQLTDVAVGKVVWAERYDRDFSDIFAAQDEITKAIVNALGVQLVGRGALALRYPMNNVDALHSFYRGLSHYYLRTEHDNARAREEFENVYRLQPDSPAGPAFLCMTHWNDASMGWGESRNRSLKQAVDWAEKATKFPEANGLAHIVLAGIHLMNRRHDEALATCYEALELRPNCPMAASTLGNVLHYCGHSTEAIAKVKEAMRIMLVYPPWFLTVLASSYREVGEIEQSISAAKHELELSPTDLDALIVLCSDYGAAGLEQDAEKTAREILEMDPTFSVTRYLEDQPYKDGLILSRLAENLRGAGLPN
jgi:adenylate cyclase